MWCLVAKSAARHAGCQRVSGSRWTWIIPSFLRQSPLFQSLTNEELREIANNLESRQYHRNEVILWQGGLGEGVYFIKSGIVGYHPSVTGKQGSQILTYLKQGDLLGEYGLLFEQNVAASATASTALSEVEVLLMKRQDVLGPAQKAPRAAAIEMIQMLTQRLLAMETQVRAKKSALCLVLGVEPGVGCTTIGSALATRAGAVYRRAQWSIPNTRFPAGCRGSSGLLPDRSL